MSLKNELAELLNNSMKGRPDEVKNTMDQAEKELEESQIDKNIVGIGEVFPTMILPDASGNDVDIAEIIQQGPVIISFYRGGWCPYCNLELKALQKALPEFKKHNAQLIAISPETPDNSLDTKEKAALEFPVLSDVGNILSQKLKLTFNLNAQIQELYKKFGIDLEKHNGNTDAELPLPATYIVGTDGVIKYVEVSTDYTKRAEPSELLQYLK